MYDDDFLDVVSSLKWAASLDLSPDQRASLKSMCCELAGISEGIPSYRLKQEAEAKRQALARAEKAEERVRELEAALKSRRDEWMFRRKTTRDHHTA
jgi:hypothetical protein